jgi:hypothetical protein
MQILLFLLACSTSTPEQPTTPTPDERATDGDEERAGLTAMACPAQGAEVVGDIGDGDVHCPDYRWPDSGQPPLAEPGGPVAINGAVRYK